MNLFSYYIYRFFKLKQLKKKFRGIITLCESEKEKLLFATIINYELYQKRVFVDKFCVLIMFAGNLVCCQQKTV